MRPRAPLWRAALALLLAGSVTCAAASGSGGHRWLLGADPQGGGGPGGDRAALAAALARGQPQNVLVHFRVPEAGLAQAMAAGGGGAGGAPSAAQMTARADAFAAAKAAVLSGLGAAGGGGGGAPSQAAADLGGGGGSGAVGEEAPAQALAVARDFSELPLALLALRGTAALAALEAHPGVAGVFPDRAVAPALLESLPLVRQPQAVALGYAGENCTVAVIDTGVDYTKAAFGACTAPGVPASCRVSYAQDFAPDDGQPDSDNGIHGTQVAAVVAQVAPAAKIAALDVFRRDATSGRLFALSSDYIAAINWAVANRDAHRICAINLSLGDGLQNAAPCGAEPGAVALAAARAAGIVAAVSSGNDGWPRALTTPACAPAAVSVGAVYDSDIGPFAAGTCKDRKTGPDVEACYSNRASFLTILAPGSQITALPGAAPPGHGTSLAAPHVAGAVALMKAAVPGAAADDIVAALTKAGMPVIDRSKAPRPRLDVLASVQMLMTGASLRFAGANRTADGASAATAARGVELFVDTLRALPAGVSWCAADAPRAPGDRCCDGALTPRAPMAWALAAPGDGLKTVTVYIYEGAACGGALLATATADILLDSSPPANVSVEVVGAVIRDGVAYVLPGAKQVTLRVAGADASGVAEMCLSSSVGEGKPSRCKWQPFAAAPPLKLRASQGVHTVRAALRDPLGNEATAETQITRDTKPPTVRRPAGGPAPGGAPGAVVLSWAAAADAVSGVDQYLLTYQPGTVPPPKACVVEVAAVDVPLPPGPATLAAEIGGLLPGTPYAFRLCARDRAGNTAVGAVWKGVAP